MQSQQASRHQAEALVRSIEAAFSGQRVRIREYDSATGTLIVTYYSTAEERAASNFNEMWNGLRSRLRRARVAGVRSFRLTVQDIRYWKD